MIIITSKYLVPKGYSGLTVFPFVFVRDKKFINPVFLNHERIHLHQQLEFIILPFFVLYGLEYLYRLLQYKNHRKAYLNISFEREAYINQYNTDYLSTRRIMSSLKYLKSKH